MAEKRQKRTLSVTYEAGPSGSIEVDKKRLTRGGEPVSLVAGDEFARQAVPPRR